MLISINSKEFNNMRDHRGEIKFSLVFVYLQESMRSNLHYHSVFWHQAEAVVEQHRAHQVVDMVVSRTVHGQWRVPLRLRDAGAYPARRTQSRLLNHLRGTFHLI